MELFSRKSVIQGALSASLTWHMKQIAWQNIADTVNLVSTSKRTVEELKTKLNNLKSKAKKNYAQRKRLANATGGGEAPPELPLWEERLLEFIGQGALDGIEGGLDTSQPDTACASSGPSFFKPGAHTLSSEEDAVSSLLGLATGRVEETDDSSSRPGSTISTNLPSKRSPPKRVRDDNVWAEWISIEREKLELEKENTRLRQHKVRLLEGHYQRMEGMASEQLALERQRMKMLECFISHHVTTPTAHFMTSSDML
ncbi:uncharacterized protein [Diadema setosum]|uniref:uncharacterized protein n=1 Tax=Diadema setosum TaxID=31175 RepID=UPI003B3B84CD